MKVFDIKKIILKHSKKNLILIVMIIVVCMRIFNNNIKEQSGEVIELEQKTDMEISEKNEEVIEKITIDIKGAIKKPGVYTIENNKRVIDAIELAGGLLENADNSVINLSKKLKDEMVIIIYTKEEIKEMLKGDTSIKVIEKECICPKLENNACIENNKITNSGDNNENKDNINYPISINDATVEELMNLPGIGESKAKTIVEYRTENGSFEKIEDIMNITGIGEKLFEQIKEYITI